jgi:3-dehydroquinate synthase
MDSVIIGEIGNVLSSFLQKNSYTKIFVLADTKTKKYCYKAIKNILDKHEIEVIKDGESQKNINTCVSIWDKMTKAKLDRHALVINLGGGVIGDMGGFCASTYKRGIDFIQIPTTLLSQVDASVGGKLGIDFESFKNHIGVFKMPKLVIIDPNFLKTLPNSELRSGFAEIIKHCLIRDAAMWEVIRKIDFEDQDWPTLISHSVQIKEKITQEDPTEQNVRKILNFGHTLGHAVETFYLGTKKHLLHGEAIAIGMICEAFLAFRKKLITSKQLNQIEEFIFAIYGKVEISTTDHEAIIKLTLQDKKNKGNKVRFSLLNGIGDCAFDVIITKSEMEAALNYYSE